MDETLLKEVAGRYKNTAVGKIEPIAPDASTRSYYRLEISGERVVAMVFADTKAAEIGGSSVVPSDEAYVELTKFLSANEIAVPRILVDARDVGVLLIEDCGDTQLADIPTLEFYKQAIDELIKFNSLSIDESFFAFKRGFTKELYLKEMQEFINFIALDYSIDTTSLAKQFESLAKELDSFEKVLVHRDFHSWNLLVQNNKIKVIDFQDALMGTKYYDVVSLLNDRDTDALIGEKFYETLLSYFFSKIEDPSRNDYLKVLLQRDLKVAGRFAKLVTNGRDSYEQWISGTLSRIERTLKFLSLEELHQSLEPIWQKL